MSASWKLSLPCTKAEAESLAEDIGPLALLDEPPVLMTSEPDQARPQEWRMDAYFAERPDDALVAQLAALVPSAAGIAPVIERIEEQDWVTLSQAGIEPIRAGRFFVHTGTNADAIPDGAVAFQIAAGRAFGTGQHETTTGCLTMLDRLRRQGMLYRNLIDVGTGTGLLAFAALRLWPRAEAMATDIDPVSIEVTEENAAINGIAIGRRRGQVELVVADGMVHRRIVSRAPYDLIVANILAGPLIDLAPPIAAALAPGGDLILAGLLDHQAEAVARAYRRQGLRLADSIQLGDWPTLRMRMR